MPFNRWYFLGFILYSVVEYILGKTNRVKPNSVIDLVLHILSKAGSMLYGRTTPKGE